MTTFDSFEELKKFMDSISEFLVKNKSFFPFPIRPPDLEPLDKIEENIIITIYDFYEKAGTTIKQIAGNFLHILHLLVPAQNFADIFKHLIYLEWMEHRIKPDPVKQSKSFYRDHILHCANVCWVGEQLLFNLEEPLYNHIKASLEAILPHECKKFLTDDDHWKAFTRITWYITAMVHDFGYPIELVEKKYTDDKLYLCSPHFLRPIKKLTRYFKKNFPKGIPLFKEQIKKIDKKKLKNPLPGCGKVHSVVGSLELLHFLKKNSSKIGEPYCSIYQLAALAIMEHHKEGAIDFDLDPFGYILALADTIHEWHRYVCVGATGHSSKKLEFISPITKVTIENQGTTNLYKIRFKINPDRERCPDWNPEKFEESKNEELKRLKVKDGLPRFEIEIE